MNKVNFFKNKNDCKNDCNKVRSEHKVLLEEPDLFLHILL